MKQKQVKFKVEKIDGWYFVMRRKVWDMWSQESKHCREDLAIKAMRRLERREVRA